MPEFEYIDFDREIWERELEEFVPSTIYDMHTHIWSEAHKGSASGPGKGLRTDLGYQSHLDWAADQIPPLRERLDQHRAQIAAASR